MAFAFFTIWALAHVFIPDANDTRFTLAFIVPAGALIGAFVLINRKDPDVMR